jgi:hypothetical protein
MRKLVLSTVAVLLFSAVAGAVPGTADRSDPVRTLDGSGNNQRHPAWGQAGTQYIRVAKANYADGVSKMIGGPGARYVSNRIINDVNQNLFSENENSQFVWTWGQFMDHDFGLRDETPAESEPIAFNKRDPLEDFVNDFGSIGFNRTPAAPGTGTRSPRQQINTISSYIDGSNVFGVTSSRLDWLRNPATGPLDGNPANDQATLMLPNGFLPRADARGNAAAAPPMDLMGALVATPAKAAVAGDVRGNENIALTAMHTLFAREHNRIVGVLSRSRDRLSEEEKFQIARRVVGAEAQFITYNEFLPALGVRLDRYNGYNPDVNAALGNEFAVVGYRAHSMIHGEFEPTVPTTFYSAETLAYFRGQGITIEDNGDGTITLVIGLNVAFGNPGLLERVGLVPLFQSLLESQYRNDEQIDNTLRSILFQVPKPGTTDPTQCSGGEVNPDCFNGVVDLGAIDIQRARDHGMPLYNDLRRAYGLAPKRSFEDITGESTDRFPPDRLIDPRNPLDDPNILDFVQLRDINGEVIPLDSPDRNEDAVVGIRRTTLAARLRAIYGSVENVDPFVGMIAEKHLRGSELGELQNAIFERQFEALRDGDRFFYANDPALDAIQDRYGITFKHTLSEIIKLNTGVQLEANVFISAG